MPKVFQIQTSRKNALLSVAAVSALAMAQWFLASESAQAASAPKLVAPTAAAVRPQVPSKPAAGGKPSARLAQPRQPASSAGQAQAAAKSPVPRAAVSPKAVASAVAVQEPVAERVRAAEMTPKAAPVEKAPAADIVKPAAEPVKPQAPAAKTTQTQAKPRAPQPKPADPVKKDTVPSFNIAQPANNSWLSSLKVKLGIAIVLVVIACAYFLGWGGGKPHNAGGPPAVNDGSGPSIIMGEGGWVEGWGGDPTGLHVGRQITIYRPSLKLSDYRLEFQASIDAKSVGWVFRAADPNNYYAMKLMTVSSGLSSKVALFKYLVANGKQTQVGRVPIDLAVHPDTVFGVRLDVRGPQFTTYIQGQQVDSWTDDQLKIGGAGFLNEREERGKVKSVSIRYLSGAGAK